MVYRKSKDIHQHKAKRLNKGYIMRKSYFEILLLWKQHVRCVNQTSKMVVTEYRKQLHRSNDENTLKSFFPEATLLFENQLIVWEMFLGWSFTKYAYFCVNQKSKMATNTIQFYIGPYGKMGKYYFLVSCLTYTYQTIRINGKTVNFLICTYIYYLY